MFFIVYKLDTWWQDLNSDFSLKHCLFGGAKLAKNAEPDKYVYSGHRIGFDSCLEVSLPESSTVKNTFIFGVDMSSSVHIEDKTKNILILGPTQGLYDTTLTAEARSSVDISRSNKKPCLSLYYSVSNSLLFDEATKIYQFKRFWDKNISLVFRKFFRKFFSK